MQITTNLVGRRCLITEANQFQKLEATICAIRSHDGADVDLLLELDDGRLILQPRGCIRMLDDTLPWCDACQSYHHPANPTCRRATGQPPLRPRAKEVGCEFCRLEERQVDGAAWTCPYCQTHYAKRLTDAQVAHQHMMNRAAPLRLMAAALQTVHRICTGSSSMASVGGAVVDRDGTTLLQMVERALEPDVSEIARTNAITNAHGVLARAGEWLAGGKHICCRSMASSDIEAARDALEPFINRDDNAADASTDVASQWGTT